MFSFIYCKGLLLFVKIIKVLDIEGPFDSSHRQH